MSNTINFVAWLLIGVCAFVVGRVLMVSTCLIVKELLKELHSRKNDSKN